MTVKQLLGACQHQIARGNGNKEVFVAKDEEGNEFVPIYYEFTDSKDDIDAYISMGAVRFDKSTESATSDDIVLLG